MSEEKKLLPSIEELKRLFDYDPLTGKFTHRIKYNHLPEGCEAGAIDTKGRRRIQIKRRTFAAHAVAFAIYHGRWPEGQVDHKNQIKTDNRISNLREATNQQNSFNRKGRSKTGRKGVTFHKGVFVARIGFNGKIIHLGQFTDIELAAAAYCEAALKYHGEFANVEVSK